MARTGPAEWLVMNGRKIRLALLAMAWPDCNQFLAALYLPHVCLAQGGAVVSDTGAFW